MTSTMFRSGDGEAGFDVAAGGAVVCVVTGAFVEMARVVACSCIALPDVATVVTAGVAVEETADVREPARDPAVPTRPPVTMNSPVYLYIRSKFSSVFQKIRKGLVGVTWVHIEFLAGNRHHGRPAGVPEFGKNNG